MSTILSHVFSLGIACQQNCVFVTCWHRLLAWNQDLKHGERIKTIIGHCSSHGSHFHRSAHLEETFFQWHAVASITWLLLCYCLLTLKYCQDTYWLLKVCTESNSCTKLRVMKISSGLNKLIWLLLTQTMGESFVIHLLEVLLLSKALQLFHYSGGTASALCFS